jgi:hypothetical protein
MLRTPSLAGAADRRSMVRLSPRRGWGTITLLINKRWGTVMDAEDASVIRHRIAAVSIYSAAAGAAVSAASGLSLQAVRSDAVRVRGWHPLTRTRTDRWPC